jgi:hypothetical protein
LLRALHSPLRYWHLLSLDAPTVAALWCWAFGRAARLRLAPWLPLALALGTWLFYVADRLLDARLGSPAELEERHHFHARHRRGLLAAAVPAALLLGMLVSRMPPALLAAYAGLGVLALGYLACVHWPAGRRCRGRRRFPPWLPKELAVALLFAAATALPAWSTAARSGATQSGATRSGATQSGATQSSATRTSASRTSATRTSATRTSAAATGLRFSARGGSLAGAADAGAAPGHHPLLLLGPLFGALCWLNCMAIDAWEQPLPGARARVGGLALLLFAAGCLCPLALLSHAARWLSLAIASSAACLLALDRGPLPIPGRRIAADLALLTPVLLPLAGRLPR